VNSAAFSRISRGLFRGRNRTASLAAREQMCYTQDMVIEQAIDIPVDRRLFVEIPRGFPAGRGRLRLESAFDVKAPSGREQQAGTRGPDPRAARLKASVINSGGDPARRREATDKLWGCCVREGDDGHWVDRFLERKHEEAARERAHDPRSREDGAE